MRQELNVWPVAALLLLFCFVPFQKRAEATSGKESCSTAWKIRLVVEITGRRFAESYELGTDEFHGRCTLLILMCIFMVFCFNDLFSTNQSIRYVSIHWVPMASAFLCRNRFSHCTWSWVPTDRFSPGIRDYVGAVEDATDAIQAAGVRPEFWRRHTAGVIHVAYGGAKIIGVEQNSRWWQLQQTSPEKREMGVLNVFDKDVLLFFAPEVWGWDHPIWLIFFWVEDQPTRNSLSKPGKIRNKPHLA